MISRLARFGRIAWVAFLPPCVAAVALAMVCEGTARGQCAPTDNVWRQDQLGFAYRDVFRNGLWQREYQEPIRQAIAWEVGRRLPEIGLGAPEDFRRQSGIDALGRHWYRDELGYAFFEVCQGGYTNRVYYEPERRAAAGRVYEQLAYVDWAGAVRRGVSSATVRGFNAARIPALNEDEMVRAVVRDRIVQGLNQLGGAAGFQDLPRFQRLVAEGVEDAIVSAFNQLEVLPGETAEVVPANSEEVLPAEASGPELGEASGPRLGEVPSPELGDAPSSGSGDSIEEVEGRRSVLAADLVPRAMQLAAPHPAVSADEDRSGDRRILAYYGGTLHGEAFTERYSETRFVDSGWVSGAFGAKPLIGPGFLILSLRDEPGVVEVWKKRVLVYRDCQYAEFFEDIAR